MSRAYFLSLILIGCFVIMVTRLTFANSPNLRIVFTSIILLSFFIFIALKLRSTDKKANDRKPSKIYLPPLLKQSRSLQILFGSVALSLILSIITLPIGLMFFSIDQIVFYIESYFLYQIAVLSILLVPIVLKKMK